MGGKQSKAKQAGPQQEAKSQWEEDWEAFLSSHPGFEVRDVSWEEKLEENDNEDQIRLVCISDTHCQVFCPNFVQGYKYTKPGRDYVGASSRRRHLDTLWRLHQLWEEGGGGEVQ